MIIVLVVLKLYFLINIYCWSHRSLQDHDCVCSSSNSCEAFNQCNRYISNKMSGLFPISSLLSTKNSGVAAIRLLCECERRVYRRLFNPNICHTHGSSLYYMLSMMCYMSHAYVVLVERIERLLV